MKDKTNACQLLPAMVKFVSDFDSSDPMRTLFADIIPELLGLLYRRTVRFFSSLAIYKP